MNMRNYYSGDQEETELLAAKPTGLSRFIRCRASTAPSILIVSENTPLREQLATILRESYQIMEVSSGEAACKAAAEKFPDLIVSDHLMSFCRGIDLCKNLKGETRTCHIPVILVVENVSPDEQIEGFEAGVDGYIMKPINGQLLLGQVSQLIRSRRELYAHFSQSVYLRPHTEENEDLIQQKAVEYILNNITDSSLCVEGLAEALNLSRSNMFRKIKALTGNSVIEFIRIIRLKHAIKLMESKKHSVAEIAYLSGFKSPAYFTKIFKESYGKPPSQYLKEGF